MHYYIDGYNLIFRIYHSGSDLMERRQRFIAEINQKIEGLDVEVTLVFDSYYIPGERTRSHYHALEILFTAHNETADELILKAVKSKRNPREVTVVTSDKKLAWQVRSYAAKTESVESFLKWLESRYKRGFLAQEKVKEQKQCKENIKEKEKKTLKEIKEPTKKRKPKADILPEECFDFYLEQFEKRAEKLLSEDLEKKKERKKSKSKTKIRSKPVKSPVEKGISEEERWLRIFKERSTSDSNNVR